MLFDTLVNVLFGWPPKVIIALLAATAIKQQSDHINGSCNSVVFDHLADEQHL